MGNVTSDNKSERTSRRNVQDPPRGRRGGRERIAERRAQAMALRRAGASLSQIAEQLGVSKMQACRDVRTAVAELAAEQGVDTAAHVAMVLAKLDALELAMWPKAQSGDAKCGLVLVRCYDRRCRLLGLDRQVAQRIELLAPEPIRVETNPLASLTDEQLLERMRRFEAALQPPPGMPGVMEPEAPPPDTPEQRYERVLLARAAANGNGGRPS
jgi:hypothetical protein